MTSTITAEDRRSIAWIDELRQKNINADAEIKSLKLQLDEEKLAAEHRQAIFGGWGEELTQFRQKNINADAEIKSLKLSLADRDEEVKTLKDEVDKQTILANGYRDTSDDYYEEKKELKDEMKSLKLQLADNDHTTFETHEHHRELRDKLNAEIKSLKLHHSSYYYRHHLERL